MTLLFISLGVLAFVMLLAIPVEIEFSAGIHGHIISKTRFRLFFGIISGEIGGGTRKDEHKPDKQGGDGASYLKRIYDAAQVKGLWGKAWELVKQMEGCLKVKRITSDLIISLGDDYYTGMLMGLAIPLVLYLNQRFNGDISLRPAFEEDPILEGDLFADFSLQPLETLVPCLAFICSPQYRRAKRIFSRGL